jgi:hypothetical protein
MNSTNADPIYCKYVVNDIEGIEQIIKRLIKCYSKEARGQYADKLEEIEYKSNKLTKIQPSI